MNGRAETDEQKRAIVERILAAWRKLPALRLGQLISPALNGSALFYAEDESLASAAEAFADKWSEQ